MILRANDRFLHVWFFDATSDATLAADFKKLGNAAGIGESVDDVQSFLGGCIRIGFLFLTMQMIQRLT